MSRHDHRNHILSQLGEEHDPSATGRLVRLRRGQVLQEPERPIANVFFPLSGVVSLLTILRDGSSVEVGCVGAEGMVGLPVFLGARIAATRMIVQVSGLACRIPAEHFRRQLSEDRALFMLMARYTDLSLIQAAQISACNRRHSVVERCARLLQEWSVRMPSGRIPVTHESLADSLGVRRAGVSEAMSTLQEEGCIRYGRGYTVIQRPRRLAQLSCECHEVIANAMARSEW